MGDNVQSDVADLSKSLEDLLAQHLDPMKADLAVAGINTEFLQEQLTQVSGELQELRRFLAAQPAAQGAAAAATVDVSAVTGQIVTLLKQELGPMIAAAASPGPAAPAAADLEQAMDPVRRHKLEVRRDDLQLELQPARDRTNAIRHYQQSILDAEPKIAEYRAKLPNKIYEIGLNKLLQTQENSRAQITALEAAGPSGDAVEEELRNVLHELSGLKLTARQAALRNMRFGNNAVQPQSAELLQQLVQNLKKQAHEDKRDIQDQMRDLELKVVAVTTELRDRNAN